MKFIDNGIERLALKLQQKQNLSHIEFLKVRLGMQVVVINFSKAVVTYGLALLLHLFLYTLIVHISFLVLRFYSNGAHAKNSILCHIQNILFFIFVPWLIVRYDIPFVYLLLLVILGSFLVVRYAPAATKKKPIAKKRIKGLKIRSCFAMGLLIIASFIVSEPYNKFILYGAILQSLTLLPIFKSKEET
ncbi:accessory gene regulator AgrB [Staphylococcus lutrae]|uniref:Accessory gene regulator protein B n=1 Tax=Staphylococcus lutrae TaxID=155085 RepID=A0AAC9RS29_9STAP|nr:accessory gene regulator AgrB [Staphylococcus lutrae]ARJ50214.1 accessory regulator AgrB [Staphylococcus lutrae]PNZ35004.1 accessory regulator AgrB [Staphylococcus lutrae]